MKQFLLIVLSAIVILPSAGNLLLLAKFKATQDEIAKTICVQKTVSNNTCKGKCYLFKKLKQLEESETKLGTILKHKLESLYIIPTTSSIHSLDTVYRTQKLAFDLIKETREVKHSYFRPPILFI